MATTIIIDLPRGRALDHAPYQPADDLTFQAVRTST